MTRATASSVPAGEPARPTEPPSRQPTRRVKVTTLTPAVNEERHIRAAVAGLQRQDMADEAEFLFIEGGSSDRTRSILEELAGRDPRIRILENPRRHTAAALNVGLAAARGEYVARIDAHSRYPTRYLSRAVARLERGDVDWVAGPQIPVGADRWSRRVAMALGSRLATGASKRWQRDVAKRSGDVELRTGVFTGVWRRATLEADGGWDEGWPVNQDSELASRVLRRGGHIVSLVDLGAEYTPRSSLPALSRQYHCYGMYRAKTALCHPETVRPPHIAMPGLVTAAAAAAVAPPPIRQAARATVGAYALGVMAESVRTAHDARDAIALPLVFVTMHVSWGLGFLMGIVRFALPSARRPRLARHLNGLAWSGQEGDRPPIRQARLRRPSGR